VLWQVEIPATFLKFFKKVLDILKTLYYNVYCKQGTAQRRINKMTRTRIEKKYGVRIADDSFYNPISCKYTKAYRIYSADGCPWENGLRTLKAVQVECEKWEESLLKIKEKVA
jgi:hypothetical protein